MAVIYGVVYVVFCLVSDTGSRARWGWRVGAWLGALVREGSAGPRVSQECEGVCLGSGSWVAPSLWVIYQTA